MQAKTLAVLTMLALLATRAIFAVRRIVAF